MKTQRPLDEFNIRNFEPDDLPKVSQLEQLVFEDMNLPDFYFIQAKELYKDTFVIAETNSGDIVGYAISATEQTDLTTAWILSIAVHPEWRRYGIAKKMLHQILQTHETTKIMLIKVTTSKENTAALELYKSLGFEIVDELQNYFGHGLSRLVLQKGIQEQSIVQKAYDPTLLMSETEVGVSFMNILFAVSAIVFAALVSNQNINEQILPFFYLIIIIFSSLYSSLFYANVTGNISRLEGVQQAHKSLRYGNVISEFLSFYPLVIVFPLIVWGVTKNETLTMLTFVVDGLGFAFYQESTFDLFSRFTSSNWLRREMTTLILLLTLSQTLGEMKANNTLTYISVTITSIVLIALTIWGLTTSERTIDTVK